MLQNINKNKVFIGIIILLVLILVLVLVFYFKKIDEGKVVKNDYSVVYLSTGEIYVGHLSTFPNLTLSKGFILQTMKDPTDPTKNTFGLNPFKNTFWGSEKLHLNKDQVVFYGLVGADSQIGKTLAEQVKE